MTSSFQYHFQSLVWPTSSLHVLLWPGIAEYSLHHSISLFSSRGYVEYTLFYNLTPPTWPLPSALVSTLTFKLDLVGGISQEKNKCENLFGNMGSSPRTRKMSSSFKENLPLRK